MKTLIAISLLTLVIQVQAGALGTPAVPSSIEIERGNGIMVWAKIGNPMDCNGGGDLFYVEKSHPQYDQIYSAILAAKMAGKKIQPYIHECKPVFWHSADSVLYNTLTPNGTIVITD